MKILVIGTGISSGSIHQKFGISVSKYYKEIEDEFQFVNLSEDEGSELSKDRVQDLANQASTLALAEKIDWADFILLSIGTTENDSSQPAWIPKEDLGKHFLNKPVFLLSTSEDIGSGEAELQTLETEYSGLGAQILATFFLPEFSKNFMENKGVVPPLYRSQLEAKVRKTKRSMAQLLAGQQ